MTRLSLSLTLRRTTAVVSLSDDLRPMERCLAKGGTGKDGGMDLVEGTALLPPASVGRAHVLLLKALNRGEVGV